MDIAHSKPVKVVTLLLAVLAMGMAGVLLYQSQTTQPLPGCGGGSSCDTVLTSRWSLWFGIPVSMLAVGVYVAMFAAVLMRDTEVKRPQLSADRVMIFCSVAVIASALWFTVVQFGVLRTFCIYCMTTHVSASAAAVLCLLTAKPMRQLQGSMIISGTALALVAALIVGQVMGEESEAAAPSVQFVQDTPDFQTSPGLPDNMLNDPLASGDFSIPPDLSLPPMERSLNSPTTSATSSDASAGPRKLEFYGGRFTVDTTTTPIIGDPYAPEVLVLLYDYTCSHCRETRLMLEKTKSRHGDKLAIICLLTPLDKKCNKLIRRTSPANKYACDLAQTSLAVWRVAPDKWAEFDKLLYTDDDVRTAARAKIAAWKLVGGEKELEPGLDDPWVGQRIDLDVRIYNACSRGAGNSLLPMLITDKAIMTGKPRHPLDIEDLLEGKQVKPQSHDGHDH